MGQAVFTAPEGRYLCRKLINFIISSVGATLFVQPRWGCFCFVGFHSPGFTRGYCCSTLPVFAKATAGRRQARGCIKQDPEEIK